MSTDNVPRISLERHRIIERIDENVQRHQQSLSLLLKTFTLLHVLGGVILGTLEVDAQIAEVCEEAGRIMIRFGCWRKISLIFTTPLEILDDHENLD
jgi:hypothetical protein